MSENLHQTSSVGNSPQHQWTKDEAQNLPRGQRLGNICLRETSGHYKFCGTFPPHKTQDETHTSLETTQEVPSLYPDLWAGPEVGIVLSQVWILHVKPVPVSWVTTELQKLKASIKQFHLSQGPGLLLSRRSVGEGGDCVQVSVKSYQLTSYRHFTLGVESITHPRCFMLSDRSVAILQSMQRL